MSAPVVSVDGVSFALDDVLLRMYPHARALVRAAMGGDPHARQEARRVFSYALDRHNSDRARAKLAAHLLKAALVEERKNAAALAAWQREQHAERSASYPVADYSDLPQAPEEDEEEIGPPQGRGAGQVGGGRRGPRPGGRVINASMPNPDIPTPHVGGPLPVPGMPGAGWTRTPPPGYVAPGHVDPGSAPVAPPSPPAPPGPTGGGE